MSATVQASSVPTLYSSDMGYSIQVPAGWAALSGAQATGADVRIVRPVDDNRGPYASVKIVPLPPSEQSDSSTDQLAETCAQQLESKYSGAVVSPTTTETLNGATAKAFNATVTSVTTGRLMQVREVLIETSGVGYQLTMEAPSEVYESLQPCFLSIENSFTIAGIGTKPYASANGYTILPPPGWNTVPNYSDAEILLQEAGGGRSESNIAIFVRPSFGTTPDNLAQLASATAVAWTKVPSTRLISQSITEISGKPALGTIVIKPSRSRPNKHVKVMNFMVPLADRMIEITAVCPAGDLSIEKLIRHSLDSIIWTTATTPAPN